RGNQSCPVRGSFAATTVASTTVSSMVQTTAPCACRAISPVSRVTWWLPKGKVFLVGFKGDLLAQIEPLDQAAILVRVLAPEIVDQLASLPHQPEQPAPRRKILDGGR